MPFGTWSVDSSCRPGALKTVTRRLASVGIVSLGVQEVRWDKDDMKQCRNLRFSVEMEGKLSIRYVFRCVRIIAKRDY
jgi:hypothetical protein